MSPRFPFGNPRGLRASTKTYLLRWLNLVCVAFVDDWIMIGLDNGGWILFYWGLMLLWMMGVGFDLGQFQGSEIFPGLFQNFMDGYIKPEDSSH